MSKKEINNEVLYSTHIQNLAKEPDASLIKELKDSINKLKQSIEEIPENTSIILTAENSILVPLFLGINLDLNKFTGANVEKIKISNTEALAFIARSWNKAFYLDYVTIPGYERGEGFDQVKKEIKDTFGEPVKTIVVEAYSRSNAKAEAIMNQLNAIEFVSDIAIVNQVVSPNVSKYQGINNIHTNESLVDYVESLGKAVKYIIYEEFQDETGKQNVVDIINNHISLISM